MLAFASIGAAQAQDIITTVTNPWSGLLRGREHRRCVESHLRQLGPGSNYQGNPALANKFYNRDCPNNGNFIGGVDLGYNFQYQQWVWGLKADYEAVGNQTINRSYTYTYRSTDPFPSGNYTASGKVSPDGILLLGPRVGYAFDQWLPYMRVGGAFTSGQHTSTLSFTPSAGGRINGVVRVLHPQRRQGHQQPRL